jgi:hypothetical protein
MELMVSRQGHVHCLYEESLDLSALGRLTIRRASHVEPRNNGQWTADLSAVSGPDLGPFRLRSDALDAEVGWIACAWLWERVEPARVYFQRLPVGTLSSQRFLGSRSAAMRLVTLLAATISGSHRARECRAGRVRRDQSANRLCRGWNSMRGQPPRDHRSSPDGSICRLPSDRRPERRRSRPIAALTARPACHPSRAGSRVC